MRPELMSFWWKIHDKVRCPREVKTWTVVENDTFADGDCHDNNNLVFIQK
jgi:hypothetical protein